MAEVERLTPEAICTVTPELWKRYVNHVKEVEDRYWVQDGLIKESVKDCLIQFGEDSDDSEINSDSDNDI